MARTPVETPEAVLVRLAAAHAASLKAVALARARERSALAALADAMIQFGKDRPSVTAADIKELINGVVHGQTTPVVQSTTGRLPSEPAADAGQRESRSA